MANNEIEFVTLKSQTDDVMANCLQHQVEQKGKYIDLLIKGSGTPNLGLPRAVAGKPTGVSSVREICQNCSPPTSRQ